MNENTTVRLHIGRLVIDAGTPLPPGGLAEWQAALERGIVAALGPPQPIGSDTCGVLQPSVFAERELALAIAAAVKPHLRPREAAGAAP